MYIYWAAVKNIEYDTGTWIILDRKMKVWSLRLDAATKNHTFEVIDQLITTNND